MSNIIQIKTGHSQPIQGILKTGELGYDLSGKKLYIGDEQENPISAGGGVSESDGVAFVDENDPNSATALVNASSYGGVQFKDFFDGKTPRTDRAASTQALNNAVTSIKAEMQEDTLFLQDVRVSLDDFYSGMAGIPEGFNYSVNVTLDKSYKNYSPEVIFDSDDAVSGNYAPIAHTSSGNILYLYAVEKPSTDLIIPLIIFRRVR